MNDLPWNEDKLKCCCQGTGWFDCGPPAKVLIEQCPYHELDVDSLQDYLHREETSND